MAATLLSRSNKPESLIGYYGDDWFLALAPSYVVDRRAQPFRRMSYSLYIANGTPFLIDIGQYPAMTTRAVLIGPGVMRKSIQAESSEIAIIDFAVQADAAFRLKQLLKNCDRLELDYESLAPCMAPIWQAACAIVPGAELSSRLGPLLDAICGPTPAQPIDPRIRNTLHWLRTAPPDEATYGSLADRLNLSRSRLRHLFKHETGVSLQQYLRSLLIWRAFSVWQPGISLTGVAHHSGAYDLAHFDRAFAEAFGRSPSSLVNSAAVRLIRCCA